MVCRALGAVAVSSARDGDDGSGRWLASKQMESDGDEVAVDDVAD